MPEPAYERRLILFIDFLGFKELVAKTEGNPKALRRLLAAMDAVGKIGDTLHLRSKKVTQFSDSIVVSFRFGEVSGLFQLLNAMALTVVDLAHRGFLLRGAITMGNLLHGDRHIVGPAMVKAYEMESQIAKYPRVIIDPLVVEIACRSHHRNDSADGGGHAQNFIAKDTDDQFYFDYVSWEYVVNVTGITDEEYGGYLIQISHLIDQGLRHESPSVLEKYLWLYHHYVAVLDHFATLPKKHPYRAQRLNNCTVIEGLPRYASLVKAARRKVHAKST